MPSRRSSLQTWLAAVLSILATVGLVSAAVTGQLLMRGPSGSTIVGPNDTGQAGTVLATVQMIAPSIGTSAGAQHAPPTGTGALLSTDSVATVSNKAISGAANTLTNLPVYFNDFGTGADGDLTCSTTVTSARVMYYNNGTLQSGCILQPTTYGLYFGGTLTIQSGGKISSLGATGASATGASTCAVTPVHTYGGGYPGGWNTTFQNPGQPTSNAGIANQVILGGIGGSGGTGGSGAGAVGGGSSFTYKSGSLSVNAFGRDFLLRGFAFSPAGGATVLSYPMGGGGGGLGGSGSGGVGASGGCGADVIGLFARKIIINAGGRIEAIGGPGANASNTNAGGGGGAGGGSVIIETLDWTNNGTVDLSGGAGGTGNGTGLAGATGSTGTLYLFKPELP